MLSISDKNPNAIVLAACKKPPMFPRAFNPILAPKGCINGALKQEIKNEIPKTKPYYGLEKDIFNKTF